MSVQKMSVHRVLAEIKLLNSKIEKLNDSTFVHANKVSNRTIDGLSLADFKSKLQSNLDRVVALIENRKRLKAALVKSNAETFVEVAGKKYTVADAIERKVSVVLDRSLLATLKKQYTLAKRTVESKNNELPERLENYLTSVLGDKGSRDPDSIKKHTEAFNEGNMYELVDPKNVGKFIEKLENEVDEFLNNIDYVLSESNATTFVEVDLVD